MKETDGGTWSKESKQDDKWTAFVILLTILFMFGAAVGALCMYGAIDMKQKSYPVPVQIKYVHVHDTVCVLDTVQVDVLEGRLELEQNKVLRLEAELEHCNNDKNYHVIYTEKREQ